MDGSSFKDFSAYFKPSSIAESKSGLGCVCKQDTVNEVAILKFHICLS